MRLRDCGDETHLDGARDGDSPQDNKVAGRDLDHLDRKLTARVLAEVNADVVALQEVFDQATLDHFHDEYLMAHSVEPWPYRVCLPGNDGQGLNVALMSRKAPQDIRSHAGLTCGDLGLEPLPGHGLDERIFRRDCLIATIEDITFCICHFKAPYPDTERSWFLRRREARAVRILIERAFSELAEPLWLILGDLNEPALDGGTNKRAIAPLTDESFAIDLLERLPQEDRWSFRDPASGAFSHPDAMIASPALASRFPCAIPFYVRCGMERAITGNHERHLAGVGLHRPRASDHAALTIDFGKNESGISRTA